MTTMTTKVTMTSTVDPTSGSITDTPENGSDYQPTQPTYYNTMYFNYDYGIYNTFMYPGYPFERTMYIYIWGILVIIMLLANLIVIYVLLQKKMRNPTNIILVCIAISDSLTGFVTLPAYWVTYSKFEPGSNNSQEVYILSKPLCQYFMITKYFLSKLFHTVSIWLTLFLGFQRFISVVAPFRTSRMFTKRNTVIICICICVASPLLHIYHLLDDKAEESSGMCQWDVEVPCKGTCVYLAVAFLLRHFLPCVLLIIFTVLFVIQLTKSTSRISHIDCNQGNAAMQQRDSENRRVSFVVIAIVVVFLIPEVPYGCFLMYILVGQFNNDANYDLETNRAIHLTYEVSLVISFHLNFYIYTFFNPRFRRAILNLIYPCLSLCGYHKKITTDSHSSFTSRRRTAGTSDTCTRLEMVNMVGPQSSDGHGSLTLDRRNINDTRDDTTEETVFMPKPDTSMNAEINRSVPY